MSFKFHLQGKTLVLIDWANVFNWLRGKKWEIDPQRLYDALRQYKNIDRICLFAGEDDHEKSVAFLDRCREIGFEVHTKKVKYVRAQIQRSAFWEKLKEVLPEKKLAELSEELVMTRKCDFDVEIAKELLLNLDKYHSYILFSGDGDYAPIIEEVMKREKRVFIVSPPKALGRELREMMDHKVHPLLVDIFSLKDIIQYRTGSRPRGKSKRKQKKVGVVKKLFGGIFGFAKK